MSDAIPDRAEVERWAEFFDLAPPPPPERAETRRRGILGRLRENLSKPRQTISPQIAGIFAGQLITADTWDELEEALITADCGMDASMNLVEHLRGEEAQGRITNGRELGQALAKAVADDMAPEPPSLPVAEDPTVILVVGVNGSGKTTTVGKLAHRLSQLNQKVVIGAADTFRAAAIDQLAIWADRSGAQLVRQASGVVSSLRGPSSHASGPSLNPSPQEDMLLQELWVLSQRQPSVWRLPVVSAQPAAQV